jgi:hypothetical protein
MLSHKDLIGYVAARNFRILSDSLTEYESFKRSLIEKYGEKDVDEFGKYTGSISVRTDSQNFKAFCDEMATFNEIEHDVEIMFAKYNDAIGVLTGSEILSIDWMLED